MASELKPDERHAVAGKPTEPMLICPRCQAALCARSCKLACERCGYYMSCSDFI